jgi:hypothetical protein
LISPPSRVARGLIESHVGRGTFVRSSPRRRHSLMARHPEIVDLSMNLPPEPDDPELLDRMQDGLEAVGRDLVSLLRYQGFGGVQADKDAASIAGGAVVEGDRGLNDSQPRTSAGCPGS